MLHPFRRLSLTTTHNLEIELSVFQVLVMGEIKLHLCMQCSFNSCNPAYDTFSPQPLLITSEHSCSCVVNVCFHLQNVLDYFILVKYKANKHDNGAKRQIILSLYQCHVLLKVIENNFITFCQNQPCLDL